MTGGVRAAHSDDTKPTAAEWRPVPHAEREDYIDGPITFRNPSRRGMVGHKISLACRCGCSVGEILGHPLSKFNAEYQGPGFVGPLGFRCSQCKKIARIIDTAVHGYNGELGASTTIRGKGARKSFACTQCGRFDLAVSVTFGYGGGELDLLEDDPDIRVEDYFDGFVANALCAACGKTSCAAEFETA